MNFMMLPPEVNSALMFTGAGSAPTLAAATAWDGLVAELGEAAEAFSSVTSGLASGSWQGPAAAAMAAAAAPYAGWLSAAATRALGAATQAKAAAAVFESAQAATVHPELVLANRNQLVSLVLSNLFGQNAPAIAATESTYEELWAQDVAATVGYHGGASAVAAQLAPWQQAIQALPGRVAAMATTGPAASAAAALASGPAAALDIGNNGSGNFLSIGNIGNNNLGSGNTGSANLGGGNIGNGTWAAAT
ncbi:PPE family protein, partial [Mycobacterium ulcerans str. Harvey]